MTAEIELGVFFGNFTYDVIPTDISFPNAAVFKQLTDNLLSSLLGF
jgi:hypothetical protein